MQRTIEKQDSTHYFLVNLGCIMLSVGFICNSHATDLYCGPRAFVQTNELVMPWYPLKQPTIYSSLFHSWLEQTDSEQRRHSLKQLDHQQPLLLDENFKCYRHQPSH